MKCFDEHNVACCACPTMIANAARTRSDRRPAAPPVKIFRGSVSRISASQARLIGTSSGTGRLVHLLVSKSNHFSTTENTEYTEESYKNLPQFFPCASVFSVVQIRDSDRAGKIPPWVRRDLEWNGHSCPSKMRSDRNVYIQTFDDALHLGHLFCGHLFQSSLVVHWHDLVEMLQ